MVKKGTSKNAESEKLKEQLARALADYDNLSKRVEREREGYSELASLRFVVKLLPVIDMIEQSQKHIKDAGLAIALKELYDVLATESIVPIKAGVGDEFDQNVHEVVEVVDGETSNLISECILSGWRYNNGQVIRPAKVKVTKLENNN